MSGNIVQVKDLQPGLKNLNITVIVLEIEPPTKTKDNIEVRTFKVADSSACINASIWGEAGTLLTLGDIIRFTNGYTSNYRNRLTLFAGKKGHIQKIGEFCMLFNEELNMSELNRFPQVAPGSSSQSYPLLAPVPNAANNGFARVGPNLGPSLAPDVLRNKPINKGLRRAASLPSNASPQTSRKPERKPRQHK